MSTKAKNNHASVRMIPLDMLTVYERVQRDPPSKASVRAIADKLDMAAIGILTSNKRDDGTYSLIDGQRRKAALEMVGKDKVKVRVLLYEGLSEAEEAEKFRLLNRQRVVGTFDDFDKGVTACDPRCIGISKVLSERGCKYGRGTSPSVASCIKTLLTLWNMDGDGAILAASVDVAIASFNGDVNTLNGHILGGLGILLRDNEIDKKTLIAKIRAHKKCTTPSGVSSLAAMHREATSKGSMAMNVAHVLLGVYGARRSRV